MQRKLLVAIMLGLLIVSFSGCKAWDKAYEGAAATTFKVNVLRSPAAAGMLKMMEPSIKPNSKLQKGEIEIAAIPTEMAAKLYNSGVNYKLAAINTGGSMYVLSNGVTINKWSDLKNQEVSIAGKGGVSDTVFRYLLTQNGIVPGKDIILKYISAFDEQPSMSISAESKIIVLPEPWVSQIISENSNFKIALDIQEEWARIHGKDAILPQTCIVVKREVAARDPEEFSLFLKDYENSINWVKQKPHEAAKLVPKHDVGVPAELAKKVIPKRERGNIEWKL